MRPKKVILLVDHNPDSFSLRKFLIETRGYRVLGSESAYDALDIVKASEPFAIDLAIVECLLPRMDGNELARRMKETKPLLPIMLIAEEWCSFGAHTFADCFLAGDSLTPMEMLERVRILVCRKRGPRKTSPIRYDLKPCDVFPVNNHGTTIQDAV